MQEFRSNMMIRATKSAPCSPIKPIVEPPPLQRSESLHKVPVGDTPYVKAKRVQLVEKEPDKAIALFWAAINAGDRVDSALKDMAIVMKQQNRPEEAIEAIKSLRHRCSDQAQEALDNILLDLYKRCGRLDDQISLLKHKLNLIQKGLAFNGRRTKTARSQGRKFQVSVEQEATRLLGNLGWALMQQENYIEAEVVYRRALLIGPDNNKMCNLGICLMKQGRVAEAKATLKQVTPAIANGPRGVDSHLKAFERAQEMLHDLESKFNRIGGGDWWSGSSNTRPVDAAAFLASSIWQPQPCTEQSKPKQVFANENARPQFPPGFPPPANALNVNASPFYLENVQDPLGNLKRTRSSNSVADHKPPIAPKPKVRRALCSDEWEDLLPDNKSFDEAILSSILCPILEAADAMTEEKKPVTSVSKKGPLCGEKIGKRLKVFQDITHSMSPRRV